MQRKINFNAGPAELPPEVLHEASKAIRKYNNTGLSILELPHRGKDFLDIIEESKALVRELCGLNDNYEILWMQGGGRLQFSMIPMNFLPEKKSAGYIDSGHWAASAIADAKYFGDVKVLASSAQSNYDHLPDWPSAIPSQLSYLHITTNNTIYGTQWHVVPETKPLLIGDMSSDILSCRRDYTQYAMFYAAAQKNIGAAGIALAVIRKDLLETASRPLPPMLSYKAHVKENSILNTVNVFGVYVSLLMLRWIKDRGIESIEKENKRKARLLYDALDSSSIFVPTIKEKTHRSTMNVCFVAKSLESEKAFFTLCDKNNITGIKGHRLVGGFRVSLYNAVPLESVELLVKLMKEFENRSSK